MKVYITYFVVLLIAPCFAQNLHFKTYTTKDGLSQNSPYSITETPDGFMWFGTQHGINRFDGKSFKKTRFKFRNPGFRPAEMITAMHVDRDSIFWAGSVSQVFIMDYKTDSIFAVREKFPYASIKSDLWTYKILENTKGVVFIHQTNIINIIDKNAQKAYVTNAGFFGEDIVDMALSFDKKKLYAATKTKIYQWESANKWKPIKSKISLLVQGTGIRSIGTVNDRLWIISTDNEIKILDPVSGEVSNTDKLISKAEILADPVRVHQSDASTVWLGSRSDGVLKINLASNNLQHGRASADPNSLLKNFILSFYTSSQGITWIGVSGAGVAKHDPASQQFALWRIKASPGSEKIPENFITAMYTDDGVNFYLSTMTGGLLILNVKTNEHSYHLPPESKQFRTDARNMYTIVKGDDHTLWLATWGGLCSFNTITKKFVLYNEPDGTTLQLSALVKLKHENKLFVAGYKMGFKYFNIDNKKWENIKDPTRSVDEHALYRARHIYQLNGEELLFGPETGGLTKYNMTTGIFTNYPQFTQISDHCSHFIITPRYWWLATNEGLIQANARDQSLIKVWKQDDGLSDRVIYAVLEDLNGNIWVSTNRGINMINPETNTINKYNEEDGLQGSEFNTAACTKDPEGNLWFGGLEGINKIDKDFTPVAKISPMPLFTRIQLYNEDYTSTISSPYLKTVLLSPGKNFINIEYQAPNFSQTDNIVYRHRLTGLDTSWVYTGQRSFVNYTKLKPGSYTLQVYAANSNMQWSNKPASLDIIVRPHWYETSLFYLLFGGLLAFIMVGLYRYRVNIIRNESVLKNKIAETEIAALKAQMNPHFIFNCINSIDAFIHMNDKYNASLYLNKFAKLIRNILDSSKENLVSFEKDIETMKLYTQLEEMRSEGKFKTQFVIDEKINNMDIKIPSLIIQPYIENAIIHGLRNKREGVGALMIKIEQNENYLCYTIEDNGVGRVAAGSSSLNKQRSYGMQLSEDRLSLFNKNEVSNIKITDLSNNGLPSGTRIELKVKINH
ncbi:MAG: histidine kinase [Saprospiraceae bacterium]|nr:histidine kinase [Saprospiraceae bacterium]